MDNYLVGGDRWPQEKELSSTAFFRRFVGRNNFNVNLSFFAAPGVTAYVGTDSNAFVGGNNAWNMTANMGDNDQDGAPFLFTKNLDIACLSEVRPCEALSFSIKGRVDRFGNPVPFGNFGAVVITKGGAGFKVDAAYVGFNGFNLTNKVLMAGPGYVQRIIKTGPDIKVTVATNAPSFPSMDEPWSNTLGMSLRPGPSKTFLLGRDEVKNREFKQLFPDHKSGDFKNETLDGPDQPVVQVSWAEAREFCALLTKQERAENKISMSQTYRLPTGKEWEAAAGGAKYPFGSKWPPACTNGNYADETFKGVFSETAIIEGVRDGHAVSASGATFLPNAFGFYDMGGNVKEWCDEWIDTTNHKNHVVRDGSWKTSRSEDAETKARHEQEDKGDDVGFRIVLSGSGGAH